MIYAILSFLDYAVSRCEMRFPAIFCLLLCGFSQVVAQDLSIVVSANGAPSRDAHFNWSFKSSGGGDVQMGQFACGSYWIAPAPGELGVTVVSLGGNPGWNDLISCDTDPITESHGLLDGSNSYGSYNASENIIPKLPMTYTPASDSCVSLVAAMQRNEAETSKGGTKAIEGEVVDAYCVVTILPSAPANGGSDMIRPNITGVTKEFLTWDDFDLNRIPTYGFIAGKTVQDWTNTQIRWRHSTEIFGMGVEMSPGNIRHFSEGGRAFRSELLISDYAAGVAQVFNNDLLALFSDTNSLVSKKPALAAMLSYGLDLYHARYGDGSVKRKSWSSGAGQWGGQYLPPVFLAALLKDSGKANELKKVAINSHGSDEVELGPQELRQLTRGVTGVLLWGDYPPYNRNGNNMTEGDWRYWADFMASACYDGAAGSCNPNKGKKTAADPYGYIDGPANAPGSSYMSVSLGGVRGLAAVMILMPEVRDVVNTDNPIEYADRVTRHGLWTAPDPVAIPSERDQTNGCSTWWSAKGCSDWGITWGVNTADIRFAIEDGVGRFTSKHGQSVSPGYESSRARDNWSSILALYNGDRFEDNVVPLGTLVSPEIIFESGANPKAYMSCPYPDAEIRYTLDGSDPIESSMLYTGPVMLSDGDEVRAKAYHPTQTPSSVRVKKFGTDAEAPSAPYNLIYSNVTMTSVDLSWSASSDNFEVSGYRIYIDGSPAVTLADTHASVDGLVPNTTYSIFVTAYDRANNESTSSNSITVTTLEDTIKPTTPARLTITGITETTISLTWRTASDNVKVEGYRIYVNGQNPVTATDTLTTITGLSPQTNYVFTVLSIDTSGNESAQSNGVQGTTLKATEIDPWLGYVADGNGDADTGNWIGWVNIKTNPWVWSYSLDSWIYARGSGPPTSGAWVYIRR